jgi:hypothetical protein
MTSRERVPAAVRRQAPDRTPANCKGEPEVDACLTDRPGVSCRDRILDRLEIDVRRIEPRYKGPPVKWLEGGVFEDYWGNRRR